MNMGCFSIYLVLSKFLSMMFCSFHWIPFLLNYSQVYLSFKYIINDPSSLFTFLKCIISRITTLLFLDRPLLMYRNASNFCLLI